MTKEHNISQPGKGTEPLDLSSFQEKEPVPQTPYKVKDAQTVEDRKKIAKRMRTRIIFPTEIVPNDPAVERAREMRQEGYGFIIPYSHADRRSPVDAITTLFSFGKGFIDAEYLGPIAEHQQKAYIDYLSDRTAIPLAPIVTEETVRRAENKKSGVVFSHILHKKQEDEGDIPRVGKGLIEYADRAGEILAQDKGIVFVAPQGGRRSQLEEPAGRAVEMLIRAAERKGAKDIAIWPMGILQKKTENLSSGMNVGRMIKVEFEEPITVTELRRRAEENSQLRGEKFTLDQQVFEEFKKVLPDSYVNPQHKK